MSKGKGRGDLPLTDGERRMLVNALTRITEKVERAFVLHCDKSALTGEDWDELHMLTRQAREALQQTR